MVRQGIELAIIQARADEPALRADERLSQNPEFHRRLEGVAHEAKNLEDITRKAETALWKKDTHDANRYIGEFALTAKNLADNLNLLLQNIYGTSKISLTNLENNTRSAPKADNGYSLYQIFTGIHDSRKNNPIIAARHKKGHSDGHQVLCETKRGYEIKDTGMSAHSWLGENSWNYLLLTKEILSTIADKDGENFKKHEYPRRKKAMINFLGAKKEEYKRNERTILRAAAVAFGIASLFQYHQLKTTKDFLKSVMEYEKTHCSEYSEYKTPIILMREEKTDEQDKNLPTSQDRSSYRTPQDHPRRHK